MLDIDIFIDALKDDSDLSETSYNVFRYLFNLNFDSVRIIPTPSMSEGLTVSSRLFIRLIKGSHSIDIHKSIVSFIELRGEEEPEGFVIDFYSYRDKDEEELSDKLKEMIDHFLRFYMKMEVQ